MGRVRGGGVLGTEVFGLGVGRCVRVHVLGVHLLCIGVSINVGT